MFLNDIGILGMAVMGLNLTLNIEKNKYKVSVYNRSLKKINSIIHKYFNKNIFPFLNIKNFINSLKRPKIILLMIKSGNSVDKVINLLKPFLKKNDIIIDGGNSFYQDTIKRFNILHKENINFFGAGISGGEQGALYGPSIMVGGKKCIYKLISPILNKISASFNKEICTMYIGPDGSGHYVKMIHNGIEYSNMQLISEAYFLLKNKLNLNNFELFNIFDKWNNGELNSYLMEITKNILVKKNKYGKFFLNQILDKSENKGTGKWISKSSLDLSEPFNLITDSVFSRYISCLKQQRLIASKIFIGPIKKIFKGNKIYFIENVRRSLFLSKVISYAQGFSLLKTASKKYNWFIDFKNIAKVFRNGCIIKSNILNKIVNIFKNNCNIVNIMLDPYFKNIINNYQKSLRYIVSYSIRNGISISNFSSAISYYDSYRCKNSSANLIQAQRDYFGRHMYKKKNKKGLFHMNWIF